MEFNLSLLFKFFLKLVDSMKKALITGVTGQDGSY